MLLTASMNHLSWVNAANLTYNSDVFTERLCRIKVTKKAFTEILLRTASSMSPFYSMLINRDFIPTSG